MDSLTTDIKSETAVLVGVATSSVSYEKVLEYLDELAFLVDTAGGVPVRRAL